MVISNPSFDEKQILDNALSGRGLVVTPSDADLLDEVGYLYIGTGGNVTVVSAGNDEELVFTNVADGAFLPFLVKQVKATGTTADDIILIF